MEPQDAAGKRRLACLSAACILIGALMAFGAKLILWLIAVVCNAAFFHKLSAGEVTPAAHHLGAWVVIVPALGGLFVGLLARYGSRTIQGHGIPEAMEQVLLNGSRIPPKILALKPLSTCVVIGTGGPFGAEGVVIATGGALGSVAGQRFKLTAVERKTLLAAGAAAGLSAVFACPISAVLLAVELLLFEFHWRSLIPVALASAAAAAVRVPVLGPGPMFRVPLMDGAGAGAASLLGYLLLGAVTGLLAIFVVEAVHRAETLFEKFPIHWMWKPALGGLIVGLLGLADPHVFGPGYGDIQSLLSGTLSSGAVLRLGALKLVAWIVGVSSATSSGTLAPLLLIGSSLGTLMAHAMGSLLDPRVAALAGMAAFFGGMSGAFLASVVLAFEATYQPAVLMPLLAATAASYLVCKLLATENIMTQKFVRQGLSVPTGMTANPLDWIHVCEAALESELVIGPGSTVGSLRRRLVEEARPIDGGWLPAVDKDGLFSGWLRLGALMREKNEDKPVADMLEFTGAIVAEDATLREAARRMIEQELDRLAVVAHDEPRRLVGVITQREVLASYRHEEEGLDASRVPKLRFLDAQH